MIVFSQLCYRRLIDIFSRLHCSRRMPDSRQLRRIAPEPWRARECKRWIEVGVSFYIGHVFEPMSRWLDCCWMEVRMSRLIAPFFCSLYVSVATSRWFNCCSIRDQMSTHGEHELMHSRLLVVLASRPTNGYGSGWSHCTERAALGIHCGLHLVMSWWSNC